jgi:hypothetical protein
VTTRRILLDPAEVAAALGPSGSLLPQELLDPPAVVDEATEQLHPAVREALALLLDQGVPRIEVRAGSTYRRRVTVLALGAGVGTSLARDAAAPEAERPLEQSVFPDAALGDELRRCLPELPVTDAPRAAAVGTDAALLLAARTVLLSGQHGTVLAAVGGWRGDAAAAIEAVTQSSYAGSLVVTVSTGPLVGRVVWVHADGGWWQLRPDADASGEPALDLLPVRPDDLLRSLAPLLAQALVEAAQ